MKTPRMEHEPTAEALTRAGAAFRLELVSFDPVARRLSPEEFLPRYHCIRFRLVCCGRFDERPLFLVVRRPGSKLGPANFYTVPFNADPIQVGEVASYELLSFDSFNLPFEGVELGMCKPEDYLLRRVSPKHIERAHQFLKRIR